MKSNLALISLKSPFLDDSKIYPPLGLLYLKSAINEKLPSVNVNLFDEYNLNNLEQFKQYTHIGLSVMTPQRHESDRLLTHLKNRFPDKKIILGGPHAKHYFSDVIKQPYDFIVPGDGQRSLIKILKGKANRIELDVMNREEFANQPRPDRLGYEARKLFARYNYKLKGKNSTTMLTADGCPQQCGFCEDAGTTVRRHPLEQIIKELDDIKYLEYKGVYLFDDIFALSLEKSKLISNELFKRNLIYRCNGQANYFTKKGEDFAKMLADTGCAEIAFGHESGSQKILNNINKKTTIEQNYKSVEYAKKHGLYVKSFLMLGLPGEDHSTIADTEAFIKNSGIDDFQLAIYYPYKGTPIREQMDKGNDVGVNYIGEGLGAYGQKGGKTEDVVFTKYLGRTQLKAIRNHFVKRYKPKSHDKFFETNE